MAKREIILKAGWLAKEIRSAQKEIAEWPEWKRRGLDVSTGSFIKTKRTQVEHAAGKKAATKS